MKTPLEAVLLILSYEQLRLRAYLDAAGKRTIGWGHLIIPEDGFRNSATAVITRERANAMFQYDLEGIEMGVERRLDARDVDSLPGPCFGALVSLAFNVGADGLGDGLLYAVETDHEAVPGWIKKYNKAGGKVLAGLTERRAAEAAMWERGMKG